MPPRARIVILQPFYPGERHRTQLNGQAIWQFNFTLAWLRDELQAFICNYLYVRQCKSQVLDPFACYRRTLDFQAFQLLQVRKLC